MENYRNICKCVVERLAGRSFLYVSFVFLQFKIRLRPRLASGCSKCSSRQHDGVHSCNFNACTCGGGLHVLSRVSREGDGRRYSGTPILTVFLQPRVQASACATPSCTYHNYYNWISSSTIDIYCVNRSWIIFVFWWSSIQTEFFQYLSIVLSI